MPAHASVFSVLIIAPLIVADLRFNNGPSESTALPPGRFEMLAPDTKNETILMLKRLLAQPLPSDRRDRVELLGVGFEWPNAPMIHGFDHTLGYNPLRLADMSDATGARDYIAGPWQRTFSPLFNSYRSLMADLLGLRYIVSSVRIGEVDPGLKPGDLRFLAHTRDGYVYENPRALPRVLFAVNWMVAGFRAAPHGAARGRSGRRAAASAQAGRVHACNGATDALRKHRGGDRCGLAVRRVCRAQRCVASVVERNRRWQAGRNPQGQRDLPCRGGDARTAPASFRVQAGGGRVRGIRRAPVR
jgi:hypothetical protein